MSFCSNCGTKIVKDDKFCSKCGTKTKVEVENKSGSDFKLFKINNLFLFLTLIAFIGGLFLIGIALWINSIYVPPTPEELAKGTIIAYGSGAPIYFFWSFPVFIYAIFGTIGTNYLRKKKKVGGIIAIIYSTIGAIAFGFASFLTIILGSILSILWIILFLLNVALLVLTIKNFKQLN